MTQSTTTYATVTDIRTTTTTVRLPSGNTVEICIQSILEENFMRERRMDNFGRIVSGDYRDSFPSDSRIVRRTEIPFYNNDRILAWGILSASSGHGYNLLLLERKDELYGKWLFIRNTNSGLSRSPRTPEPFAFQLNELEKEIPLMNTTHLYSSDPVDFDENILFTFITDQMAHE